MKRMILTVVAMLMSVASLLAQSYELIVLDDEGTTDSCAYSINVRGYSVGYKNVAGVLKPYLWAPDRGWLQLETPSGTQPNGIAYSISDYFDVVGTFGSPNGEPHQINSGTGALWFFDYDTGSFLPATTIGGNPASARAVNANRDIAGYENNTVNGFVMNLYNPASDYSAPMNKSYCYALNDRGNAAGKSYVGGMYVPLYVRKEANGVRTTVTGESIFRYYGNSSALDINTNNQVVGTTPSSGFYWEPETGLAVRFDQGSSCYAINNLGCVVGTSNNVAYMWKKVGNSFTVTDLNSLVTSVKGVVLQKAFDINDKGQIVGQCLNTNTGVLKAFLLTPATRAPRCLKKALGNQLEFNWLVTAGHTYAFRFSEDLKVWESYPDLYYADTTRDVSVFFTMDEMPQAFIDIVDTTPN